MSNETSNITMISRAFEILDYMNLYFFSTVTALALATSSISLIVYTAREFTIPLYSFFRVYCINNMIFCFILLCNFTINTPRILPFSNTYIVQALKAFVVLPITYTSFYYGRLLNMVIILDRIAYYKRHVRSLIFKTTPYKMCAVVLLIAILMNIPYFFVFVPKASDKNGTAWSNDLRRTNTMLIVSLTFNIFRDLFILVLEIVFNILTMFLLRNYLIERRKLKGNKLGVRFASSPKVDYKKPPVEKSEKKKVNNRPINHTTNKCQQRASLMVIVITFLSTISHAFVLICTVYYYFYSSPVFFINFAANFVSSLKCLLEFIIYISLCSNFRGACIDSLGKSTGFARTSISTY